MSESFTHKQAGYFIALRMHALLIAKRSGFSTFPTIGLNIRQVVIFLCVLNEIRSAQDPGCSGLKGTTC